MSARRGSSRGAAIVVAVIASSNVLSCDPVEARRRSIAPNNACSESACEAYAPGANGVRARCSEGRCIVPGRADAEYTFWIVTHVPGSSSYGAGITFVRSSEVFSQAQPAASCSKGAGCITLTLPRLVQVRGTYKVLTGASDDVAFPQMLPNETSIPVRVMYTPFGRNQFEPFPRLPLEPTFTISRIFKTDSADILRSSCALPAGQYRRTFFPEAPFDGYFPPRSEIITVPPEEELSSDEIRLAGGRAEDAPVKLDDIENGTRSVSVKRAAGLDGWRVWFADELLQRRISTVKTLTGTEALVRLDTTGENRSGGGLGRANLVVAPPEGVVAVPELINELASGAGREVVYLALPPPSPVQGLVAATAPGGTLLGFPATVAIQSRSIFVDDPSRESPLLKYGATVETDAAGRFATVLPPGTYSATITPATGTGFSVVRRTFEVKTGPTQVAFESVQLTRVQGRVELTDERPLASADVFAMPRPMVDPNALRPRPFRTRTDADGNYSLELDQGSYILTVVPEPWTGFPRVAVRREILPNEVTLPPVRVPVPTRLALALRSPSVPAVEIVGATVRIFAAPDGGGDPIEVGVGMTDGAGEVEILLAREP